MATGVREYVYNEPSYPWKDQVDLYDTKGNPRKGGSYVRRFADGKGGGPDGITLQLPEGFSSEAHFHTECQFQVALEGTVEFPRHPIEGIGVHYTDANTAYGPFICKSLVYMATLRPRKASKALHMAHTENRKFRNPYGREIVGEAKMAAWEDVNDVPGARRKVIFGAQGGPAARLLECVPGARIQLPDAPYGEWQIVVKGSAVSGNEDFKPYAMRYVVGHPSSFIAGPEGVTWLLLTFDEAALKSGAQPEATSRP